VTALELQSDVPLAPYLTMGVGGPARHLVPARSEAELGAALSWARSHQLPVLILGGGSNLICGDQGFKGLVIDWKILGISHSASAAQVDLEVAAGEPWDKLVAHAVARGWSGLESLSGIPGRVGATPLQNVGAYGQEVSQVIRNVTCLDRQTGKRIVFDNTECRFGYRTSRFKTEDRDRFVITKVCFSLSPGAPPELRYPELQQQLEGVPQPSLQQVRDAVIATRRAKSMVLDPSDENGRSCGSFFVNPVLCETAWRALQRRLAASSETQPPAIPHYPQSDGCVKLPAAWLIERAGFARGHREGNVGISTRHTLALVCHDGATTTELVGFARRVKARVRERFGVTLQAEPQFVGVAAP
jgi:UDP-N-acetylmuramate dehydrogenase